MQIWSHHHKIYSWWFRFRNHRKLGNPCKTDLVLDRDGYSLGYSFDRKCALWASYTISKRSVQIDVERELRFYSDTDIPSKHRVYPTDFRNSGYDKGHLAPSGSIDFSRRGNRQTFLMSNIALQHPELNRHGWQALEKTIRCWTRNKGILSVVTGPIYGKRSKHVNGIPVPRRFYKVIYSFNHNKCIGFVMPNRLVNADKMWRHAMSVQNVEQETGYNFFNKLYWWKRRCKSRLDMDWWRYD
ncbi:MAG: hypothetical protein B6242_15915 [Anaerolineaceae bacterium 4572_78]|nr:MAG: hypothetical protein B6242_15915 [Anaerolineaceae bacterium 4572_78]